MNESLQNRRKLMFNWDLMKADDLGAELFQR